MARLLREFGILVMLSVLCLRGACAAEPVLNLYIWSDYLAANTLSRWRSALEMVSFWYTRHKSIQSATS